MDVLEVSQETAEKLTNSLIKFVVRVADGTIATPEEKAILPAMTKIILEKLHVKATGSI